MSDAWFKKTTSRLYRRYVTYLTVTPILVTAAIIVASVVISGLIERNLITVQSQAVTKQLNENKLLVQNAFDSYAQLDWSGVGRLNSAPIDRTAWGQFVGTYQLQKNYPAISGMGVSRVLKPEEQSDYLAQLSAQYSHDLTIIKGAAGQTVEVSAFSQPEKTTTLANIGFNINSDPARHRALQASTDANNVVMTDQLELIINAQAGQTSNEPAFVMYAPYYAAGMPLDTIQQRRDAVIGHVSVSFRTNDVFKQVFSRIDQSHVAIRVTTGNNNNDVLYSSKATQATGPQLHRLQTIGSYSQTFKIDYAFDSDYLVSATQLHSPLYTTILGSMIAALVGTMTYFFLRGRHHRLELDKERDITRAKDELLSLASHQLRTPATGVKQYVGMVLQGFAGHISPHQEQLLEKAYESNERQLRIINDILHLAKLDLGRIVLARTNFQLADLVQDVIDEQKQGIQVGQLKLTTKLPKKSPIYADNHMLRMVIENIISNAIKYTDPGGHVSVQLRHSDDGYDIIVKDTGVGIDQADMPKLFKQFSRLMNPRSHLVSGTGVGLYLAKNLTWLHGGDITVTSQLGKGSSFTIFIPNDDKNL
jgi:signal transduction histidine kinase